VKFNFLPVVRRFCDQVTDAIHRMHAGKNPLVSIAIHDRPQVFGRQRFYQLQILAECLQSNAAPDIVIGQGVPIGLEELIKRIFMQRQHDLFC